MQTLKEKVLKFIEAHPGANSGDISRACKSKAATAAGLVSAELSRMHRDGVVSREKTKGKGFKYTVLENGPVKTAQFGFVVDKNSAIGKAWSAKVAMPPTGLEIHNEFYAWWSSNGIVEVAAMISACRMDLSLTAFKSLFDIFKASARSAYAEGVLKVQVKP